MLLLGYDRDNFWFLISGNNVISIKMCSFLGFQISFDKYDFDTVRLTRIMKIILYMYNIVLDSDVDPYCVS